MSDLHTREREREQVIDNAVREADEIICAGAENKEELAYFTGMVAKRFLDKLIIPVNSVLLTRDLFGPEKAKWLLELQEERAREAKDDLRVICPACKADMTELSRDENARHLSGFCINDRHRK
jgi:hypothetical protein